MGQRRGAALSLIPDILFCLKPRCPVCREGGLFRPFSVTVVEKCAKCGAPLGENDIGDGAAVFLIFLLGFTIVPMAWLFELAFAPPMWVHIVLWGAVCGIMIGVTLPALKAYILLLEYRHRTPGQ